ncbi:hypothetical protein HanHA300_Chr10g0382211 [Helianthus annuus]|nr:hypothetical protein HanHA300_Chr10g0382211 [Helianthus annuus]
MAIDAIGNCLTPNELGGGLGKEASQTNQEWRKNTIRMQGK